MTVLTEMTRWLDRTFLYAPPAGEFPMIAERLRGTPARAEEKAVRLSRDVLTRKPGDAWSIQEHIGHLLDLEPLWAQRLEQILAGSKEMSAADVTNRATFEAHHNEHQFAALLAGFRRARETLLARLDELTDADVVRTALHPRLKRPMRTIDLCFFIAEHDDHHLALVTRMARSGAR